MEPLLKGAADKQELDYQGLDYCDDYNYHRLSWMNLSYHPMMIYYHDLYSDYSSQLCNW